MNREICPEANGQKVLSVNAENTRFALVELERGTIKIGLDGDCCSDSYWNEPEQFDELVGTVVRSVEDRVEGEPHADKEGVQECTKWHFLVFVTDKGHVTIDWRNDSNGYYDGSIDALYVPKVSQ